MIDLERLAREAGMRWDAHYREWSGVTQDGVEPEILQRFAQLVAEEAARICDRSKERAVMSKFATKYECLSWRGAATDCATAIRSAFGIDATKEQA